MSGLFVAGWSLLRIAEAFSPWFVSAVIREIRLVCALGSIPVWVLAMVCVCRDYRFVPIPILHEMAITWARHLERKGHSPIVVAHPV